MGDLQLEALIVGPLRRSRSRTQCKPTELVGEAAPLHQPHDQKRTRLLFAYFVDRDDIRVIQLGRGVSFSAKTSQGRWRVQFSSNHLQGDVPLARDLARAINNAHSATPNPPQNLEIRY